MALGNLLEGAGREGGVVGLAAVPAHAGGGRAVRAVRAWNNAVSKTPLLFQRYYLKVVKK